MLGSGGFSLPRTQGGDQFYNPQMRHRCHPHHHQQQQLLIQQQQQQQLLLLQIQQYQQLQRPLMIENRAGAADVENRADSDDWPSTCLASVPRQTPLTNIERLVEVVTPFVIARRFFEGMEYVWSGSPNAFEREELDSTVLCSLLIWYPIVHRLKEVEIWYGKGGLKENLSRSSNLTARGTQDVMEDNLGNNFINVGRNFVHKWREVFLLSTSLRGKDGFNVCPLSSKYIGDCRIVLLEMRAKQPCLFGENVYFSVDDVAVTRTTLAPPESINFSTT